MKLYLAIKSEYNSDGGNYIPQNMGAFTSAKDCVAFINKFVTTGHFSNDPKLMDNLEKVALYNSRACEEFDIYSSMNRYDDSWSMEVWDI